MRLYRALKGCSYGSRGFLEDRMMDIITGRAPPPARAESHLSRLFYGCSLLVILYSILYLACVHPELDDNGHDCYRRTGETYKNNRRTTVEGCTVCAGQVKPKDATVGTTFDRCVRPSTLPRTKPIVPCCAASAKHLRKIDIDTVIARLCTSVSLDHQKTTVQMFFFNF